MNSDIWRPRLIASIAQAYRQCWGEDPHAQRVGGRRIRWATADGVLTEADMRLIAKADLILPLATAGLLAEREGVSDLPAPAEIRQRVREHELHIRSTSIGCQLAGATRDDDSPFSDEAAREWSTWITYCMQAHSPELRATLVHLPRAVEAMSAYRDRPRRRIERMGPDGERLLSLVPSGPSVANEDDWIEPLLDHCETVAAHADSFQSIEQVFPELFHLVAQYQLHRRNDFEPASPFHPYLWPFSIESFRHVMEIAQGIRYLAQYLNGDDDGDGMQMRESTYARV
ncbi:MAG TPA: hypothetical protein VES88_18325 [Gemmatimonadaceae bacterium]|nr:hypothetical protein [Gemmatimonadaceae bacterium]